MNNIKKMAIASVILCISELHCVSMASLVQANACTIQANDQIIAAGYAVINPNQEILTVRYNTNGSIDTSFGASNNGQVLTVINVIDTAYVIALDANQKIIIAGSSYNDSTTYSVIARYNTDGSLDTTFNTTGYRADLIGDSSEGEAIAIGSDGKIIVAGVTTLSGQASFFVARYNTDGSIDTTFGSQGITTTSIGYHAGATAIGLQSDGTIIVGGFAIVNSVRQCVLASYTTAGTLNSSFGTMGVVTTPIGDYSQVNALAISSNDGVIVGGFSDQQYALAGYNADGTTNTSFGTNGIVTTIIGKKSQINAVRLQSDGNLLAAGTSDGNFSIARYTTAGVLDTTFGTNGVVTTVVGNSGVANAVAIQSDNKIVVVGNAGDDVSLVRYSSTGVIDPSWGILGIEDQPEGSMLNVPVLIYDQKSVGTNGGTFTADSWQPRDLTTINSTNINISLAANQITLLPGQYHLYIVAPAYKVGIHQIRLQDITDNYTVALGNSSIAGTQGGANYSTIDTIFTVSKQTVFEIQHQCTITETGDGFGIAAGFSNEIYTQARIIQLS